MISSVWAARNARPECLLHYLPIFRLKKGSITTMMRLKRGNWGSPVLFPPLFHHFFGSNFTTLSTRPKHGFGLGNEAYEGFICKHRGKMNGACSTWQGCFWMKLFQYGDINSVWLWCLCKYRYITLEFDSFDAPEGWSLNVVVILLASLCKDQENQLTAWKVCMRDFWFCKSFVVFMH